MKPAEERAKLALQLIKHNMHVMQEAAQKPLSKNLEKAKRKMCPELRLVPPSEKTEPVVK